MHIYVTLVLKNNSSRRYALYTSYGESNLTIASLKPRNSSDITWQVFRQ